ncbi:isoprenylcysteine carboxylmethyltransferase family protein [Salinisphaera sp.]|uniref:methyltransferase family protein n=1 Tax=Salinisphaera sp. TaxID=1914330 RepID=UPI002D78A227|nr:isoprenylcysteine carboxylmethyltransferase family protein [Salinisphaera sp.]HET7314337.1 isoprenylcysteine carboxylmethyltransferase family protein [Salinisphaera sp.]
MINANRETSSPLSSNEAGADKHRIYPDEHSIQNADVMTRLRARRITPRLLLAYAAAAGVLLFAAPWAPTYALGSVVVGLGLVLRIWTFGHLRKNQNVITTGPYAHTRNPAYVGSALVMTGLFIAAGNPYNNRGLAIWMTGIAGLYVFFKYYMPRKYRREYGKLRKLFGPSVAEHAAHVPDFFPRLTPWRSGDTQRFSWACVRANHELVWPVAGIIALIIVGLG